MNQTPENTVALRESRTGAGAQRGSRPSAAPCAPDTRPSMAAWDVEGPGVRDSRTSHAPTLVGFNSSRRVTVADCDFGEVG